MPLRASGGLALKSSCAIEREEFRELAVHGLDVAYELDEQHDGEDPARDRRDLPRGIGRTPDREGNQAEQQHAPRGDVQAKISKPMFRHLSIERRAAEAELLRGLAQVAAMFWAIAWRIAGFLERFEIELLLRVLRGCDVHWHEQILEAQRGILRHDHGSFDGMHQLADIAGPRVLAQLVERVGRRPAAMVLPYFFAKRCA